jgi:VanZ family protein
MDPNQATSTRHQTSRVLRWVPVVVWACVIFGFSSLPGSSIPGRYSVEGHFVEYAILGLLAALSVRARPLSVRAALLVLALCSLYAISDELHQAFVPGRVPDVADLAMDTVGAGVGIAAAALVLALARRRAGADRGGRAAS